MWASAPADFFLGNPSENSFHPLPQTQQSQPGIAMSKPSRPSNPDKANGTPRTFFVTTRTAGGKSLFQTERMTDLFIDVLRCTMRSGEATIHDFVIMPNHVHILLTIPADVTLERRCS
jgi:putative transposase